LGLELEWVGYSRKNYTFPGDQLPPHSTFDEEMAYLKSNPALTATLRGSGYVLGPITGDHWFVFVADKCERPSKESTERTVNLMMFDLDPEVARTFYVDGPSKGDGKAQTSMSGLSKLCPGWQFDEHAFEPCGYSMNALRLGSYATVHVTPEPQCSYASFETNDALANYDGLIRNVLAVFKPRRFVLTMFADAEAQTQYDSPFSAATLLTPCGTYARGSTSSATIESDTCLQMAPYTRLPPGAGKSPKNLRPRAASVGQPVGAAGRPKGVR